MPEVRFDDVATLESLVSEKFGPFGPPLEVTQQMVDRFADLTHDHQWIHVDVERARRESPFGQTIAHGFLVLSLLPALKAGNGLSVTGMGASINYGADKLRFVSPVPCGSQVHLRRRLAAVSRRPKGVQLTQESEIRVVGAERPAVAYRQLSLYLPPTAQ